jgi:hypothetical protein
MNTPGFTAEMLFHETSNHYSAATVWTDSTAKLSVLPAAQTYETDECTFWTSGTSCGSAFSDPQTCQAYCSGFCQPRAGGYECCTPTTNCAATTHCKHFDGDCTGTHVWFWDTPPTRCVTADSGFTRCAGGWNQYPWVVECNNGSRTSGVGFCLW